MARIYDEQQIDWLIQNHSKFVSYQDITNKFNSIFCTGKSVISIQQFLGMRFGMVAHILTSFTCDLIPSMRFCAICNKFFLPVNFKSLCNQILKLYKAISSKHPSGEHGYQVFCRLVWRMGYKPPSYKADGFLVFVG